MENGLGARDAIEGLVELGEFFPLRFKFALFIFILLIYINLALIRAEKHWDWTLVRLILLSVIRHLGKVRLSGGFIVTVPEGNQWQFVENIEEVSELSVCSVLPEQ